MNRNSYLVNSSEKAWCAVRAQVADWLTYEVHAVLGGVSMAFDDGLVRCKVWPIAENAISKSIRNKIDNSEL